MFALAARARDHARRAVECGGRPALGELLLAQHLAQALRTHRDRQHVRRAHPLDPARNRDDVTARGFGEHVAGHRPVRGQDAGDGVGVGGADARNDALGARQRGVRPRRAGGVERHGAEPPGGDAARHRVEREEVPHLQAGHAGDGVEHGGGEVPLAVHGEGQGAGGLHEQALEPRALAFRGGPRADTGEREQWQGEGQREPNQQPAHRRTGAWRPDVGGGGGFAQASPQGRGFEGSGRAGTHSAPVPLWQGLCRTNHALA